MTTAYTPILQLALPVTGELDGTWGSVVNDNITSMIEQAIAGLATINTWTTASHTLTTADGTTDEARCAMLECSGAPGAAATVVCPARTKLFVIKNSVTGGYAVTLKTSAGTGISVPNGSTALLYCDGTNVVSGATYMATVSTTQVDILAQGDLRLQDTTGGEYVAFQAPATLAASYTLTMPADDGTAGQALVTDGNGVLSWSTAASGDVYGPASATDTGIATFDGTTGKLIKNNSGTTIAANVITATGFAGALNGSVGATTPAVGTFTTLTNTGTALLGGASGNQSLQVNNVASGVNYLAVVGNTTGNIPVMTAAGADANVSIGYQTKGAGIHYFQANGGNQLVVGAAVSSVNWIQATGAAAGSPPSLTVQGSDTNLSFFIAAKGTGQIGYFGTAHNFYNASSATQFTIVNTASAVNYLQVTGGATGNGGILSAQGLDANVAITYNSQGAGGHGFTTGGTSYSTQFLVTHTASAVNYLQVTGAATGSSPALSAQGTDTNISSFYTAKGSGSHSFYTNGSTDLQFRIAHTAGAINWLKVTGSALTFPTLSAQGSGTNIAIVYTTKGTEPHYFQTDNAVSTQFVIAHTASAVNFLEATGSATGSYPALQAGGSDTNIGVTYVAKGLGYHQFTSGGSSADIQLRIGPVASAVNYLQVQGAATGGAPSIEVLGANTNISSAYTAKGSGNIFLNANNGIVFVASGAVANPVNYLYAIGSATGQPVALGSAGSDTNIDLVLTPKGTGSVKDAYGNLRSVPQTGAAKTSSYTLVTTDVGQFVQVSTSGSVVIPNSTFAAGDIVSLFNNTSGNITVTCSTTNAYIAGTNTNKTSVTLATRGVATVLFITSTLCVISGNVT